MSKVGVRRPIIRRVHPEIRKRVSDHIVVVAGFRIPPCNDRVRRPIITPPEYMRVTEIGRVAGPLHEHDVSSVTAEAHLQVSTVLWSYKKIGRLHLKFPAAGVGVVPEP